MSGTKGPNRAAHRVKLAEKQLDELFREIRATQLREQYLRNVPPPTEAEELVQAERATPSVSPEKQTT